MSKTPKIDRIREHLANERTFLAWMRTSIALIGFGFAIARFTLFLRSINPTSNQQQSATHALLNSENLGLALVLFGMLTVAMAAWRYNQVFWQIERTDYQHNRLMIWIMTGVVMFFGFLSIPLLLLRNSTSPPPQSKNHFS